MELRDLDERRIVAHTAATAEAEAARLAADLLATETVLAAIGAQGSGPAPDDFRRYAVRPPLVRKKLAALSLFGGRLAIEKEIKYFRRRMLP